MTELKDMSIEERINEIAKNFVCPLNNNPQTPYELGYVKQLAAFGRSVSAELLTCFADLTQENSLLRQQITESTYIKMEWKKRVANLTKKVKDREDQIADLKQKVEDLKELAEEKENKLEIVKGK